VFYRAGIVERRGMGTLNIIDWCKENSNPPPIWSQETGSVLVTFKPAVLTGAQQRTPEVTLEVTPEVRLLEKIKGEMSMLEWGRTTENA
jgi:ATP-dependent DNA helicase RecG